MKKREKNGDEKEKRKQKRERERKERKVIKNGETTYKGTTKKEGKNALCVWRGNKSNKRWTHTHKSPQKEQMVRFRTHNYNIRA